MNKNDVKALFFLILTILIITGIIYLIIKQFSFNFSNSRLSKNLIEKKQIFDLEKNILVDFDEADVYIESYNGTSIKIELYGENIREYEIDEDYHKFDALVVLKGSITEKSKATSNIKIYLPNNYAKTVFMKGGKGDIYVDKLNKANIEAELEIGNIKIKKAYSARLTSSFGDIHIGEIDYTLWVTLDTGNIDIGKVKYFDGEVTTGNVKIDTISKQLKLYIKKTGEVYVDEIKIEINSSIRVENGNVTIHKAKGMNVLGYIETGDVRIKDIDKNSDNKLTIDVNMGDISVN